MELSIHKEVTFVKDVFSGKMWYTFSMDTTNIPTSRAHSEDHGANCSSHSMERAIRLLGDMWTLMIVHNLLTGSKRFGELLEVMGNVSPKTVSQRLKMLEEIKFVDRQAFAEIPPRVEYRLTEKGLALVHIMDAIQQFAEQYLADDEVSAPFTPPSSAAPPCS